MKPRITVGLIAGIIGFVLNACISTLLGICGPVVALLVGAIAGLLAARQERPATQSEGGIAGLVSGIIAGAFLLVAQLIAGALVLLLYESLGLSIPFAPQQSYGSDPSFWISGLAAGMCFGIADITLAAGGGWLAGYLVTSNPSTPSTSDTYPPTGTY